MFGKIRLYPETPIEVKVEDIFKNDTLEFQNSIKKLSSLLLNIQTPFTIGIYGDWGSGKTSFMDLLRKYLQKEHDIKSSLLNAWEYENENSLRLLAVSCG